MKSVTVDVKLDVYDLANEFSSLDSSSQAKFFALIASRFDMWRVAERDAQLLYVAKELVKDHAGTAWVKALSEFIDQEKSNE